MKKIALVGSTGSIGRQVINVVKRHGGLFSIAALIARSSVDEFEGQLNCLAPAYAALTDEEAAKKLSSVPSGVKLLSGESGALKAIEESGADVVVVACGGFSGLIYSLKAVELNIPLALANKETLVCGGDLIMPRVGEIMPVDSEHSAIWQCLGFDRKAEFSRLVITASGGPFRGKSFSELSSVTPEQALCHPTWKMGAKITIDCATLLNKGYEVIEAHHLYNASYDKITAVIHPQSIVHSMVQFADGATLAQTSYPSMELPIQLALTYPERLDSGLARLDFSKALSLEFFPLEKGAYPLYDFALECGREGGVLPTALNAASEVAVGAFLRGEIGFTRIYDVVRYAAEGIENSKAESFEQLSEVDGRGRARALKYIKEG